MRKTIRKFTAILMAVTMITAVMPIWAVHGAEIESTEIMADIEKAEDIDNAEDMVDIEETEDIDNAELMEIERYGDYLYGDYLYYNTSLSNSNKIYISSCDKSAEGEIIIPSKINGKAVTSIASDAFSGCSSLTSVIIPDSVTSIGDSSFFGCSGLTSVIIPDSVTSIGYKAFSGCSGLTSVTIPDSVTSIGIAAFYSCSSITSVAIPDSVTSIGERAFDNCNGLTNVIIGNSITSIKKSAFFGCSGLKNVIIPDSVTSIGDSAFSGCSGLTNVIISDSVTSIGGAAFSGCSSLTSVIIPDSVTSIGDSAFSGCSGLMSVTILGYVTSMGNNIFRECNNIEVLNINSNKIRTITQCFNESLKSVTIGNSVTSIETYAFKGCSGLTSVTIPDSVTSIGDSAFSGCSGLTSVTIPDSVTNIDHMAFYGCSSLTNVTMGNSVSSIGYKAFSGCSNLTSVTIPDSVTSIGESAFSGCSGLTSVTIPDSVTSIGESAFSGCSGLTSVTIPDSVTSIGKSAFYGCEGLKSMTIPDSVTSIGYGVFSGCSDLKNVTIGNSVTSIGYKAFSGCSSLTSVVIPNSVTSIGDSAFSGCSGLTSVTIPDSVISMNSSAFIGCNNIEFLDININKIKAITQYCTNSLKSVTIGNSVTSIETYAFKGCSGLTSVTIPDSVTSIGDSSFFGCSDLTSVTIPDSVTDIGHSAFYECNGLTSVTIPDSVTDIGHSAFYECNGLTSVTIGNSVTSIGSAAFSGCSSLKSVIIPDSVISMNSSAFKGCSSLKDGIFVIGTETEAINLGLLNCTVTYTPVYVDGKVEYEVTYTYSNKDEYGTIHYLTPTYAKSISIYGNNTVGVNKTTQLKVSFTPSNTTNKAVTWSSSDTSIATVSSGIVTGKKEGTVVITAKSSNGHTAKKTIDVADGEVKINVISMDENFVTAPLKGAEIELDGVKKKTDSNGDVTYTWSELSGKKNSGNIKISNGDEYESKDENIFFISSVDGKYEYNYTLKKLEDKIKIKTAEITLTSRRDLLKSSGMNYISAIKEDGSTDNTRYSFNVTVDWGKYVKNDSSKEIYLIGMKNGLKTILKEGENSVCFTNFFDVDEGIKLVATVKDDKGNEIKTEKVLPLKVKILNVSLPGPETKAFSLADVWFLKDLDLKLSTGDFGKQALQNNSISYKNGILKLEFKTSSNKDDYKEISAFELFKGKSGLGVNLTGTLQIPLVDSFNEEKTEWSGKLSVSMKNSANLSWKSTDIDKYENGGGITEMIADGKGGWKKVEKENSSSNVPEAKLFSYTHNFAIYNIPCFVDTSLSAGIEGNIEIFGPYNKVYYKTGLTGSGTGTIGGGVGGAVNDNVELKFGPEGSLNVKLPMTYTMKSWEDTKFDFDPSITGALNIKASAKFFKFDLGKEIEVGKFVWNKDGTKWTVAGIESESDEVELASIEENWQPIGRDYLKNGGGFVGDNNVELFEISNERAVKTVYENIIDGANAVMTEIDGKLYLLFTADNAARDEYNAVSVMYSEYDGSAWSSPVVLDEDGTIDYGVSASGKFAVWENNNRELTKDDTLENALAASDIKAGVWNGNGYDVTELSNDDIYDFCVKVKSSGDKALVAWLSNTEEDFSSQKGITSINYSVYDGGWSEVQKIEDVGQVTNINVLYDGENGKIVYKNAETGFMEISLTDNTPKSTAYTDIGRYAVDNDTMAYFDTDNKLHIVENETETAVIESEFNKRENPVIAMGEQNGYIFWLENDGIYYTTKTNGKWSEKLCFNNDDASISELSCNIIDDNNYTVSYIRTSEGVNSLITAQASTGADLVAISAGYASDTYAEDAAVDYALAVGNNGEIDVNGGTVNVYEEGELVYTQEFSDIVKSGDTAVVYGKFDAADGRIKHNYTFEVVADNDYHIDNNTVELIVGTTDISISDSYFGDDENGRERLYILAENTGSTVLENVVVSVYKDSFESEPIYKEEITSIKSGDTAAAVFNEVQDRNTVYYIKVETVDGDETYSDTDAIAYDRIDSVETSSSYNAETGMLSLNISKNDGVADNAVLIISVYDNNNSMKNVITDEISFKDGMYTSEKKLADISDSDIIKIMCWSDIDGMQPIMPAENVK